MRLAEALAERKDVLKRISAFPAQVIEFATWDDDDKKPDPKVLADLNQAYTSDLDRLQELNVKIHEANNVLLVTSEFGQMTLMEAIALRDRLNLARKVSGSTKSSLEAQIGRGAYARYGRRSKEEVKTNTLVAPRDLSREEDALAGQIRRLDLAIQQVNWTQDLP